MHWPTFILSANWGEQATAALSISINALFVILMFGHALGIGAMAMIAKAWGQQRYDAAKVIYQQIFWLVLIIGGSSWLLASIFYKPYIRAFTDDIPTAALGMTYFKIYALSFLLHLFLMVHGFCFRAAGDFVTPMKMMLVSIGLNVVLDPILIFGLGPFPILNLKGAALATVISQGIAVFCYLVMLLRRKSLLNLYGFGSLHLPTIKQIMKIGVPGGVQYLVLALMVFILFRWVKVFGPEATAAVGIGFRILHTTYLPMISVAVALAAFSGQNWGAELYRRVKSAVGWSIALANAWAVPITAALMLWPAFFLGWFTSDAIVIQYGEQYLRIFGISNFLVASVFALSSFLQGLGKTVLPLVGALLKAAVFLSIWLLSGPEVTLRYIYGAAVITVAIELLWDIIFSGRTLTAAR